MNFSNSQNIQSNTYNKNKDSVKINKQETKQNFNFVKDLPNDSISFSGSNETNNLELAKQAIDIENAKLQNTLLKVGAGILGTAALAGCGVGGYKFWKKMKPNFAELSLKNPIQNIAGLNLENNGNNKKIIENLYETISNKGGTQNILLSGPGGTGKTYCLEHVADLLKRERKVDKVYVMDSSKVDTKEKLVIQMEKLKKISKDQKIILIWDEMDNVCENPSLSNAFKEHFEPEKNPNFMIWGSTNFSDKIEDPITQRINSVPFETPSAQALKELAHSKDVKLEDQQAKALQDAKVTYRTLTAQIALAKNNDPTTLTKELLEIQNATFRNQFSHFDIDTSGYKDKEIMGKVAKEAEKALTDEVGTPNKELDRAKFFIYEGPPGMGKTLIPNKVAADHDAILINGTFCKDFKTRKEWDNFRDYLINLNNIMDLEGKKAILFIDEADTVLLRSDKYTNQENYSITNDFKEFIHNLNDNKVTVVASTNHINNIDDAIKSRGSGGNNTFTFKFENYDEDELDDFVEQCFKNHDNHNINKEDLKTLLKNDPSLLEGLSYRSIKQFIETYNGSENPVDYKNRLAEMQRILTAPAELNVQEKLIKQLHESSESQLSEMNDKMEGMLKVIQNLANLPKDLSDSANDLAQQCKEIQKANQNTLNDLQNYQNQLHNSAKDIQHNQQSLNKQYNDLNNQMKGYISEQQNKINEILGSIDNLINSLPHPSTDQPSFLKDLASIFGKGYTRIRNDLGDFFKGWGKSS